MTIQLNISIHYPLKKQNPGKCDHNSVRTCRCTLVLSMYVALGIVSGDQTEPDTVDSTAGSNRTADEACSPRESMLRAYYTDKLHSSSVSIVQQQEL